MPRTLLSVVIAALLMTLPLSLSAKELPFETLRFSVKKGTWINLDVSPNGRQIVFDLLGDLYLLPISGGKARRLTSGTSWDVQPRFSGNGKTILFTSDRSGGNNSWLIDVDGKNPRAITRNKWVNTNMPIWRPGGRYIVNRRRKTDRSSIGTVELWMHHVLGGSGIQLTSGKKIGDGNDHSFSPDGRYLYFAKRGRFRYNRNVHSGIWSIGRLDLKTSKLLTIAYNATRPTASPKGRYLALIRRVGKKSMLVLHDLSSGSEKQLIELDRDIQEGFSWNGTYPAFSWTPDGKSIVYTAGGRLWRVAIDSRVKKEIPFSVDVEQKVTRALLFTKRLNSERFTPKILRWPTLSPRGDLLVWSALGQLWSSRWPRQTNPRKLTAGGQTESAPGFSADGRKLAYVSWSDSKRGHVWVRPIGRDGRVGAPTQVTRVAGYYSNPAFSPDGSKLVFVKSSGSESRGLNSAWQPYLLLQVAELKSRSVTRVLELKNRGTVSRMPHPRFSKDGRRIFFTRLSKQSYRRVTTLASVRLDGSDERRYISMYNGEEMIVSPDERWVLFRHEHHIFLAAMPPTAKQAIFLGVKNGAAKGTKLPTLKLSLDGGLWPSFGSNGKSLHWSLGNTFYTLPLTDVVAAFVKTRKQLSKIKKKGKTNSKSAKKKPVKKKTKQPLVAPKSQKIRFEVPVGRPKGCFALTELRLVTMKGRQIIENGTILVENDRIKAIGPKAQVTVSGTCRVFRLKGKTALPGFVDTHAHLHYTTLEIYPQNHWEHQLNLAYGVTTAFDPSAPTDAVFGIAERIRAGLTVGPRIFSTGFILYGAENSNKAAIYSLKQARGHLKRLKALGALAVKSYMQPTRRQRRWVIQAAFEQKMLVMPEGGGNLQMNLTMVLDGHTGIEHSLPVAPLHDDVVTLFAKSHSGYSPTLLVSYGHLFGENYYYQTETIFDDPKLKRFFPPRFLDAKGRRRQLMVKDGDWYFKKIAESAGRIIDAGGHVQIGSHGQLQGLGYHWEMDALHQGGVKPFKVLRAATIHGARYLGLQKDIGSLEVGKLADIVIVSGNPLKRLRDARQIQLVVKNGEIFNANTMDRIWPKAAKRPRFFWETTR